LTTTASDIAKLPREVFVVDDEHVDALLLDVLAHVGDRRRRTQ
jgi:hypothetical protein